MRIEQWKKRIVDVSSLFFIILFTYAATSKLLIFETFHLQLEQSPFIGMISLPVAIILPAVLLIISFLLIIPKFRLIAFYFSLALLIIFNLYIIGVLNFAESIPCSCGGFVNTLSWNEHLIFNIGCSLLALLGIALSYDLKTINSRFSTSVVEVKP
ncbi:MauE/DoxX family redox-associated membrane protein [Salinimicrobium sp. GXAS 041]|uniref:MauE/DoxX family redox-associated membrane protein n=1 Tax=Salinimicrobium sp. GXAS 041 TaxID=3400806 RepID=UPI003C73778E